MYNDYDYDHCSTKLHVTGPSEQEKLIFGKEYIELRKKAEDYDKLKLEIEGYKSLHKLNADEIAVLKADIKNRDAVIIEMIEHIDRLPDIDYLRETLRKAIE